MQGVWSIEHVVALQGIVLGVLLRKACRSRLQPPLWVTPKSDIDTNTLISAH